MENFNDIIVLGADSQAGDDIAVNNVAGAQFAAAVDPSAGGSSSPSSEPITRSSGEQLERSESVDGNAGRSEDLLEFYMTADAIHRFREDYRKIETAKLRVESAKLEAKKNAIAHKTTMASLMMEMEERRTKTMMEIMLNMMMEMEERRDQNMTEKMEKMIAEALNSRRV